MADSSSYLTPHTAATGDYKELGSRFIGHLAPAHAPEEAHSFLEGLRRRYHDATHHCWAWRLGWAETLATRFSDDGEPSHTAGEPILHALDERGISNAVCVVVRYFGGTKLGTGGLARAYKAAARAAIEGCSLRETILCDRWEITFPYAAEGSLRHAAHGLGVHLTEAVFGESVAMNASVPRAVAEAFAGRLAELRERWKGEVTWKSK